MIKRIINEIRQSLFRAKHYGKHIRFLSKSSIDNYVVLEGHNSIGSNNILSDCELGYGTYTGRNTELHKVKVGRFCSLGSYIRNTTGRHPTKDFVSTHPAFFSCGKAAGFSYSDQQLFEEITFAEPNYLVTIGNDVWIGDGVTIMDGVRIGDGAIIGANSLVTKDVDPYSISVGTPARTVRYRFDKENIQFLLKFKWWNKDIKWIKGNIQLFSDIDMFKSKIDENLK